MIRLPQEFKTRMQASLGSEYEAFEASYLQKPKKALRVNTLRISAEDFKRLEVFSQWELSQSEFMREGFIIGSPEAERAAVLHPYHEAYVYYIQEPSAMSVAAMLSDYPFTQNTRVLDMCAAPGGKTGAIAAYMQGKGVIVANEMVKKRALELAKNIEGLGITNAVVTNASPETAAEELGDCFDIVVVDAPCSGEGMFRKNPSAVLEWSVEHVKACAARQMCILRSAAQCVKEGGLLLYSTCTFSHEEDEDVAESFLRETDFELLEMKKYFPHSSQGEGHFVCLMQKCGSSPLAQTKKRTDKRKKPRYKRYDKGVYADFIKETMTVEPNMQAYINENGKVILANDELLRLSECTPCISCGVLAGYEKSYFDPAHTFFMAAHGGRYGLTCDFTADSRELEAFFRGESIEYERLNGEKGYCLIACDGFPLGFCKAVDGILKNKLPKGLRR